MPYYPKVKVELVGHDGNAFAILARARKAIIAAGIPLGVFGAYRDVATSGDYDHLLATTMEWFSVDGDFEEEDDWEDEDDFL